MGPIGRKRASSDGGRAQTRNVRPKTIPSLGDQSKSLTDFNQNIANYSRKRRFGDAVAEFHRIRSAGLTPSEYSYVQIVNACSRAGREKQAKQFISHCQVQFGVSIHPTTHMNFQASLLRLYTENMQMTPAFNIILPYLVDRQALTPRLFNSFLRGCLRSGTVQEAYALFKYVLKSQKQALDITSLGLMIELLCYAGCGQAAFDLYSSLLPKLKAQANLPVVTMTAELKMKVLLCGCRELDKTIRKQLRSEAKDTGRTAEALIDNELSSTKSVNPAAPSDGADNAEEIFDDSEEKHSHLLFASHKVKELIKDLKESRQRKRLPKPTGFLYLMPDVRATFFGQSMEKELECRLCWGTRSLPPHAQFLDFSEIPAKLTLQKTWEEVSQSKDPIATVSGVLAAKKQIEKTLDTLKADPNSLTIIELGAGSGDWCGELAREGEGKGEFYIANELRWNRCCEIRARAASSNLMILGGDGKVTIRSLLPSALADYVFLNFPEPPQVKDSPDAFINTELLEDIHKVLKPGGKVAIVSDQKLYMAFISGTFVKGLCKAETFKGLTFSSPYYFEEADKVSTTILDARFLRPSTYFERLWQRGNKTVRYVMVLQKPNVTLCG